MNISHPVFRCFVLPLLAVSATLAQAATPATGITPVDMRGMWFPKSEAGAAKCANYLSKLPVEPDPEALVVSERQMILWAAAGQNTMHFVTDVAPRRANTWRMQALVDVPPYELPKVLQTYVFELRQDELHWSSRRVEDPSGDQVDTAVFARCGY